MPWYLYLALRHLFPQGRRFPFFTGIAALSVALGVALLVLVLGVMGGFGAEIRRMIVDTQGEVQVRSQAYLARPAEVLRALEAVEGVQAATPFAEGVVMIEHQLKPAFPAVQGIDLERIEKVIPLRRYLRVGSLEELDDDSVILSSQLARSVGAYLGSTLDVYTPLILEKLKREEIILPRQLKVVGIIEVGHQQLDSNLMLGTLRLVQELYGLGTAVHGINVRLRPGQDADEVAARINREVAAQGGLRARSWFEINQDFLWVLQLEKNMMLFILLFVVLVAAFLNMSLLLVLVVKKTREIGLFGALGAERGQIALCFCVQGLAIGVVGTLAGLGLGFLALAFRNDAVRLITRFTGSEEVLARFYQFSQLPAEVAPLDLLVISVSALLLSTLAGVVPAVLAARMKPVEALRSE